MNVVGVIHQRLQKLPDETQRLLGIACVLGREFAMTVLSQMVKQPPGALMAQLAPAVDQALLQNFEPGKYRFSHIMIRQALYLQLPSSQRSELHLHAAQVSERGPDLGLAWAEIAHHYIEAGPGAADDAFRTSRVAAASSAARNVCSA